MGALCPGGDIMNELCRSFEQLEFQKLGCLPEIKFGVLKNKLKIQVYAMDDASQGCL